MGAHREDMHLVYAIDTLASGGAQRQCVELAVYLNREPGVRVSILIYRDINFHADRLDAAGIPVVRLPKSSQVDPLFPLRVRRWARASRPDVMHAFLPMPALWFFLGLRLLPGAARPAFVAGERNSFEGPDWPWGPARRAVYPRADAVTVNSRSMRDEIERRIGVPAERIHYLPNGIDLEAWDAEAEGDCPLELEPGCFHLALVGGLRRQKNHGTVLEALERLGAGRTRGWRVWFVGDPTLEPDYAAELRAEVDRRHLSEVVRIVPPVRRVAALMRRLDGLVLPSLYEGFPNVVLEGMASRIPVIASPAGDVPNMVDSGRTGLVLERADGASLAAALEELRALAPAERASLGERARAVVEQRYAMPVVAGQYLELYRTLVAGRGPTRSAAPAAR